MEIAIFVAFVVYTAICIYLYFRRKKYTRERFAFFSTFLVFSFAFSVLTHLFTDKSLINIGLAVFNKLPLEDIPLQTTSWSDKLWSLVVLMLLMAFVRAIYENWPTDGVVSAKDSKLRSKKKTLFF